MEIVGLFMAGWGSNNKYALISAMRAVNQIISYDLPFIFAALVPVLLAGSLRLSDIAAAQAGLMIAAADQKRVPQQVAFNRRFAPLVRELRRLHRVKGGDFEVVETGERSVQGW